MSTFPPKNSKQTAAQPRQVTGERGPVSTGNGGIPASLKVKAAGTKDSPNVEKINSLS